MIVSFVAIEIDNSFISEMVLLPSKAVRLRLYRSPQAKNEKQVTQEQSLQFSKVESFSLNLEAKPWLEIKAHHLLNESEYLRRYLAEKAKSQNVTSGNENSSLHHFRIVCDEGVIDVLAEEFAFSLVDEIPFVPHSKIRWPKLDELETSRGESAHSAELTCAFCDKAQSYVAKIIAGPIANICDECIAKCSRLIRNREQSKSLQIKWRDL